MTQVQKMERNMRKRGWRNQMAVFLYDKQIGGQKLMQIKKSFHEVSDILQGKDGEEKKKSK